MRRLLAALSISAMTVAAMATEIDPSQMISGTATSLGMGTSTRAVDVYNNTAGTVFNTGSTPRWHGLDDGSFTPGAGAGGGISVDAVDVGFVVTSTAATTFDMYVQFYDTLNLSATGSTPVNSVFLGGYGLSFTTAVAPGAYNTGLVTLGTPIFFPDDNWAVELIFVNQGTTTPSNNVTFLFANGPASAGSSDGALYFRDANGDGTFTIDEARSFTGNNANFYLRMTPEPASLVLLALGGLLAARRR